MKGRTPTIEEMSDRELHSRWTKHIFKIINDVWYLLEGQRQFREVLRYFSDNEALHPIGLKAHRWLMGMWGTEAMMTIRREMDDQHGVINLRHMLYEMEKRPHALTRFYFMVSQEIPPNEFKRRKRANRQFDSYGIVVGGPRHEPDPSNDYLDPAGIANDRKLLERDTKAVFRYAQMYVAHRTPVEGLTLTGAQLDDAISTVARIADKYYFILVGESLSKKWGRLPKGWRRAFTVAWHVEKKRKRRTPSDLTT